jgi:hypothetical protein
MPHLYAIDLTAVDLTDQLDLEDYTSTIAAPTHRKIESKRFNKTVVRVLNECVVPGAQPGSKSIAIGRFHDPVRVIPGLPLDLGNAYVPDLVLIPGFEFLVSGEHYYEPTDRSRLTVIANPYMSEAPNRMSDRRSLTGVPWTTCCARSSLRRLRAERSSPAGKRSGAASSSPRSCGSRPTRRS